MSLATVTETTSKAISVLPLAVNLLLFAIILVCAWQGFKKGIIMGIVGIFVIILSLYGAQLVSDTFSYEVIPVLKPFVSGYVDNRVEDTTYELFGYEADENGEYNADRSVSDLLESQPESRLEISRLVYRGIGIYGTVADNMAEKAVAYAEQNNATLSSAIVNILCQSITWCGGFLLAFIVLFAVLTVVTNILNLSFRVPYIGIVNDLGGLGIGIFTGFLLCAVVVWALQFTGLLLPETALSDSRIAGWFLEKNMLGNYISF